MKKILLMLLAATTLFSSCSSDNDNISQGGDNSANTKKYTVNLNVKSAGFEIDKTPLKSETIGSSNFLQVVVYEENGEVHSDTIITSEAIKDVISDSGNFPFSLNLPEGNYHLAFIQKNYYKGGAFNTTPESAKLKPQNFYTDVYGGGPFGYIINNNTANVSDYYQSIDISVFPNISQTEVSNIVLEPMWSIVSIYLEDFIPPTNCNFVTIDILPAYTNYNLYDKLAPTQLPSHHPITAPGLIKVKPNLNNGTIEESVTLSKTYSENNNMKLVINWYENHNGTLIMTTETDLNTKVENGRNYKVIGKLGSIGNIGGGQMNISFAPFNDDPIDLPF